MDAETVFRYSLVAPDGGDLEAKGARLVARIRDHAAKHDFAQRIHVDQVSIEAVADGSPADMALLVPFHKEAFPELAVLNRYIEVRAQEVGLALQSLILPDGSSVPLEPRHA